MTMSSDNGWNMKGYGEHASWSFGEWLANQLTAAQITLNIESNERLLFANRNRLVLDQISLIMVNRIQAVGRR